MSNGFYGTEDEWTKLEKPLKRIDQALEAFANKHDMTLIKNDQHWPSRFLELDSKMGKKIQIYLADQTYQTYTVWICMYQYRDGKRYWKNQFLKKSVLFKEIEADLDSLLSQAKLILDSWEEKDLEEIKQ